MIQQLDIPSGWLTKRLSYLIKSMDAGVSVNSEDRKADFRECGILKTSAVTSGIFNADENKAILASEVKRAKISPTCDRIIMSRMNTPALVGANAYVPETISNLFLPDRLWLLTPKEGRVNMRWLAFVLGSPKYRSKLSSFATGTSNSMKNITKGDVASLPVLLPPLPEQRAIADLLSTWDEAIEKTEWLIDAKQQRFRWLLRSLISDQYSMNNETAAWKKVKIGSFLTESKISGTNGRDAQKITVKLYGKGVIAKDEKRIGSETTQYYVRKSGQFIYSKLDFLNGAFGIIPEELNGFESTLDLPAFDISDSVSKEWFLYYLIRPEYYTRQLGLAKGQRKARRVNPSEFLKSKIPLPPIKIQNQIAEVLSSAQHEIDLLKQLADKYKTQKRGLMQKMLTGEWRVKPEVVNQYE